MLPKGLPAAGWRPRHHNPSPEDAGPGPWRKINGRRNGELAVEYRPVDAIGGRTFPRDIFGHRTEVFEDHPSVGWVGADVWFGRVAGYDRLELAGSTSWLDHTDAVGTMTMQTNQTGAETWDVTHYPWGQPWQQTGPHPTGGFYADLEFAINDPAIPSATREYNPWYYRWLTPDPGGRKVVKLDNPQTWNMYAYALDNPTSLNDPSGLYTCQGSKVSCNDIKTYYRTLEQAGQNAKAGSKERNDINRALKALGKPGERNGVTVSIVNSKHWTMNTERVNGKEVITVALGADKNLLAGKNANVTDEMAGLMGHEGTHVADYQAGVPVKGLASVTGYERRGVMTQAEVARELGYDTEYNTWSTSGGYSRKAINLEVNAAVADDCRMDALECQ